MNNTLELLRFRMFENPRKISTSATYGNPAGDLHSYMFTALNLPARHVDHNPGSEGC